MRYGFLTVVALVSAGCSSSVRVRVDARVVPDVHLRGRLAGPSYVIRGPDGPTEASLAFQEFAGVFAAALQQRRPELHRVELREPADFAILLQATVADRGTGMVSSPVYGETYGHAFGPYGPVHYSSFGVVGTEVRPVHLGYNQTLIASAYVMDPKAPAGRQVLWEGAAGSVADEADIAPTVPYLALALVSSFGESTEGPRSMKFKPHDIRVEALQATIHNVGRPASRPQ